MKGTDKKPKTTRKKMKENATPVAEDNAQSVICSKSYIVPGNPLAPHNRQNWDRHVEELARAGGKFSVAKTKGSHTRLARYTPLASISGVDRRTPAPSTPPLRIETPPGKLIPRKLSLLPEIDKKYLPRGKNSSDDTGKQTQPSELEIPEGAEHIQTTNSAVSFTLFYKPPSRRLEPLPRYFSDVIDKKEHRRKNMNVQNRARSPKKHHRSGGIAMDSIRKSVEGSRRQRERKNMAVTRAKLELLEANARFATPETISRMSEVLKRQDKLREENYLKSMKQFLSDQNKKK